MRGITLFGRLYFPKVKDINDARDSYNYYSGKNCPKRAFALKEWNRLYLPTVQKAIQDKNVIAFFKALTSYEIPPEGEVWKEGEAAIPLFLSMISTSREAKEVYSQCISSSCSCSCCTWSNSQKTYCADKIKMRWIELSSPEIEAANSIPEIKSAIDNSFRGNELFIKGIMKWVNACHTVDEIKELAEYALHCSLRTMNSSAVKAIEEKTISILLAETLNVTDIKTIKSYYHFAPKDTAAKIFIFERWLELCTTPEEANEAFIHAPEGRLLCQAGAYKRVKMLLKDKT